MSKKHFQKLAYELMRARPDSGASQTDSWIARMDEWNDCVAAVANACAQSNAAFDRGRFVAACEAESYSPSMHGR
jgi:hypothetical protein